MPHANMVVIDKAIMAIMATMATMATMAIMAMATIAGFARNEEERNGCKSLGRQRKPKA